MIPVRYRLISGFLACIFTVTSPVSSNEVNKQEMSAELYWYYEKQGLLEGVETKDDEVTGYYFEKHGKSPFRIKSEYLNDQDSKNQGYLRVLDDLVSRVTYSSGNEAVMRAEAELQKMTGLKLKREEWDNWLNVNRNRLRWSRSENRFVLELELR
jgi:hypothetical protein